jgi:hypothetical protein
MRKAEVDPSFPPIIADETSFFPSRGFLGDWISKSKRRSSALSISSGCGATRVFVERYVKLPRVEKKKEDFL